MMLDRVMVRRALRRGGSTGRLDDPAEPVALGRLRASLTTRVVVGDPVRARTTFGANAAGAPSTSRSDGNTGL